MPQGSRRGDPLPVLSLCRENLCKTSRATEARDITSDGSGARPDGWEKSECLDSNAVNRAKPLNPLKGEPPGNEASLPCRERGGVPAARIDQRADCQGDTSGNVILR